MSTPAGEALAIFMPSGRRGRFPVGTPLLDCARALGVYVESVCGGRGICGRCQIEPALGVHAKHGVTVRSECLSAPGAIEEGYARRRTLAPERRLSCAARLLADVVIDVPTDVAVNPQVVRKRAENRRITRDPATRLHYVEIGPPDIHKPLGDGDRVLEALVVAGVGAWAGDRLDLAPHLLAEIQPTLAAGDYKLTCAVHADDGGARVVAMWPGYVDRLFGLAVDIGSTTIACHLVDLATGRTIASAGTANPQIRFGEDLMSRVSYVMMNPDGAVALTRVVREAVATLALRVAGQGGVAPDEILEAVLVGNPIMHHLYLGIDPRPLGQAPFALAVSGRVTVPAAMVGLPINPGASAYLPPCIAGHVGADAAAVALAEAPHASDAVTLVVDVGTNAEILLGNRDRLLAASSPTGPAFEGAEIGAGQRAAPGAIERVRIDPATLEPRIKVIGVEPWSDEPGFAEAAETTGVTGICGSGIIEALAELFLAGVITADGVIDGAMAARGPRVFANGRTHAYRLWRAGGVDIVVGQSDVRAIQLAKAALYAGARLLMDRLGVARVDRVRLAGAFGSHIDPKYAMVLGLIPDCPLDQVAAVGNAAGTGARMALLNRGHRREVEALVRRVEKIETAMEPTFQAHFVAAMALPNKVDPFPYLAAAVTLPSPRECIPGDGRRRGRRGR
jgi:uncharacterized 2Fe-2S/4Fe-4S cluster protein (DUF4445 family)